MSPAIEFVVGIVRFWEFPDRPTVKPVTPVSRDIPEVVTARSNEVKDDALLAGWITTFPVVFTVVDDVPLFGTWKESTFQVMSALEVDMSTELIVIACAP
jgi:hypothetical protein